MKNILGGLVITSVLIGGLFTTTSTTSAASLNNSSENSGESVQITSAPILSKYIRIPWKPGMKQVGYMYDDGMFRGTLNFVGGVWDNIETDPPISGWSEGWVHCYKNCAIANSIVDEKE